jgi:protein TonB
MQPGRLGGMMEALSSPQLAYAPKKAARGVLVVLGMHLLLGWALVSGLAQRMVEVVRAPIETRLIEEIKPPPPPPPPDLPKPTTPPPPTVMQVPVPVVIPQVTPPPQITPPPAAPPPPPVNPAPAPVEAIRAPAPAPAPPAAPSTRAASPEEIYVSGLRSYLNSIKRYPTSREARQLRPQGIVKLKLSIDRAGQLLEATVEASSGSLLLDNEALRTVRNGRFPAIPAEAFAGQATRTFIVPMEYLHEGG